VRLRIRRLLSRPLLTFSILASLALGIGVTTAAFSFLNDLLLAPPTSFLEPERILETGAVPPKVEGGPSHLPVSYFEYRSLADSQIFSELAASQVLRVLFVQEGRSGRVDGEMVTSGYFHLAKVRMALGRAFEPAEDGAPGQHSVAVLSYEFWQERLGGQPDVLGSTIRINGYIFTIIGVTARGFRGMNRFDPPDFWVPVSMYRQVFILPDLFEQHDGRVLRVFGRMRPGMRPEQARKQVERLGDLLTNDSSTTSPEAPRLTAWPLGHGPRSEYLRRLEAGNWTALGAAFAFLLIACSNVANLMLVQARLRTKENALQLALGAGRGRLARREIGDGLLLAMVGGALGLLAALAIRQGVWRLRPSYLDDRVLQPALNGRVLAFVFGVTLLTALLCSAAPMLHSWRSDLLPLIRQDTSTPVRSGLFSRLPGQLLVLLQIALSAASLGLAALFLSSLWRNLAVDPGFEVQHMAQASFDLQLAGYDKSRVRTIQERLLARIAALPNVQSAALGENRLLGGFRLWRTVSRRGTAPPPDLPRLGSSSVDENYFETVAIPKLQGRFFDARDRTGPPVVILNQALAARLFPGGNPVGEQVVIDQEPVPYEVIGVVASSSYLSLGEDPQPFLYLLLRRNSSSRFTIHIRTATAPASLLEPVRKAVREVDPLLPVDELVTMEDLLRQSQWMPRLSAWLLAFLGGLAVILAGVGVYGVAASSMQHRQRDIAMRLALGAQRAEVVGSLLGRGLVTVLLGMFSGLVLMLWLERWIQSLLYKAGELGWRPLLAVLAILTFQGMVANLVPVLTVVKGNLARVLRES
jgi:predicted permease